MRQNNQGIKRKDNVDPGEQEEGGWVDLVTEEKILSFD